MVKLGPPVDTKAAPSSAEPQTSAFLNRTPYKSTDLNLPYLAELSCLYPFNWTELMLCYGRIGQKAVFVYSVMCATHSIQTGRGEKVR